MILFQQSHVWIMVINYIIPWISLCFSPYKLWTYFLWCLIFFFWYVPSSVSVTQAMSWSPCSPACTGTSHGSSTYPLPWRTWFQMPSLAWQQRSSRQVHTVVSEGGDLRFYQSTPTLKHASLCRFLTSRHANKTRQCYFKLGNLGHCWRIWSLRAV